MEIFSSCANICTLCFLSTVNQCYELKGNLLFYLLIISSKPH